MATDACKSSRVKINGEGIKASSAVVRGDLVDVKKNGFNLQYKVVELIDKRVSATLAEPCYENLTPQEELNKYKDWFVGKAKPEIRERGAGRPTKRERREIDRFKNRR